MEKRSGSRTFGFIVFSTITHVALAAGVLALNVQSEQSEDSAPVEIVTEISSVPEASEAPTLADIPKQVEAPAIEEEVVLPMKTVVEKPKPVQQPVKAAKKEERQPKIAQKLPEAKHEAKAEPVLAAEESPVVIPVSQPEETLERPTSEIAEETLAETEESIQEQAPEELATSEVIPDEVPEEIPAEAFPEDIAKEAILEEKLEKDLAEKTVAPQQAEEAKIAPLPAPVQNTVSGHGGSGSNPDQARALKDLRQVPGNKRPMYDSEDRLHGRQGEVSFKAYVSKEGAITEFKMTKSSGHRALDAKTLKALKTWKFYPGQEGWVEIPFQWDLKGEPREKPTTLRMKSQANQFNRN